MRAEPSTSNDATRQQYTLVNQNVASLLPTTAVYALLVLDENSMAHSLFDCNGANEIDVITSEPETPVDGDDTAQCNQIAAKITSELLPSDFILQNGTSHLYTTDLSAVYRINTAAYTARYTARLLLAQNKNSNFHKSILKVMGTEEL